MNKNARTALLVFAVVIGMVAASFASVPLYSLFCKVTGFGGTTKVAVQIAGEVLERQVTVKFNADIASDLPWQFEPEQREVTVHLGEQKLIHYRSQSQSQTPTAGTAMYNVTPEKAGKYFQKIQCFCFDEQILKPGERVSMPVMFYIDPAMAEDRNLDDVTTITLSYTFFKSESEELEQALEDFYNQEPAEKADTAKETVPLTE